MQETKEAGDASSSESNSSHHSDSVRNAASYNELMPSIKTETHSACLSDAVAKSPLFKLPREIRDMIYRFALIHYQKFTGHRTRTGYHNGRYYQKVSITQQDGIPEPSLLSVSKLVRLETHDVFYYENIFSCDVEHFHPAPVLLAERKARQTDRRTGISDPKIFNDFSARNWKNLVSWLHMCHRGECRGWSMKIQGNEETEDYLLQGLFDVATEGPNDCSEALDFLLRAMRPALVSECSDWALD